MLNKLRNRMNSIYLDNSIPLDNIEKRIVYKIKQRLTKEDWDSFTKLKKLKRKRKSEAKICVVFLLQMPEVWGETETNLLCNAKRQKDSYSGFDYT